MSEPFQGGGERHYIFLPNKNPVRRKISILRKSIRPFRFHPVSFLLWLFALDDCENGIESSRGS